MMLQGQNFYKWFCLSILGQSSNLSKNYKKKYYFDNKKFYADLGLLTSPNPEDRSNAHQNWIASFFQKVPQNYPCKSSAPPGPYPPNGQWPNVCRCTKKTVFATNATLHNSYCARRTGKRFQKSFVEVSTWMGRNKERELVHDSLVNCQTR